MREGSTMRRLEMTLDVVCDQPASSKTFTIRWNEIENGTILGINGYNIRHHFAPRHVERIKGCLFGPRNNCALLRTSQCEWTARQQDGQIKPYSYLGRRARHSDAQRRKRSYRRCWVLLRLKAARNTVAIAARWGVPIPAVVQ